MSKLPWLIAVAASVLAVALFIWVLSLEQRLDAVTQDTSNLPTSDTVSETDMTVTSAPEVGVNDALPAPVTQGETLKDNPTIASALETSTMPTEEVQIGGMTFIRPAGWTEIMEYQDAERWAKRKYESLFNRLHLSPNVYDAALSIFRTAIHDRDKRYQLAPTATFGEHQAIYDESITRIDRGLAGILSREDLNEWRAFEAEREEREMREGFEIMLMSSQPDLAPEVRVLAAQLLSEEIIAARLAFANAPMNGENNLALHEDAINSVWTRIDGMLVADHGIRDRLTDDQVRVLEEAFADFLNYIEERSRKQN